MKNKDQVASCVICGIEVNANETFGFAFNDEMYFFCNSHAEPFKMGLSLGQLEINSKFLSFISHLPDPVSKSELKKSLMQLVPMSRLPQLDAPEQIFELDFSIETPKQLYDELNKTVIGQDIAKKSVSVAVINHLQSLDDFGITHQADKHHILLLGKSGSGKTLMATTIAKLFNLPYAMGDATNYSPTGFHGSDADSIIQDLLIETDMNFELAERGVLFIDEIDKICCSNKNAGKYESFIGSTQSTLLKLIEGKIVKVPGQAFGEPPGSSFNIDSSRMLFFFGGAFNGLAEIIAKKMGKTEKTMGFITKHDVPKNKEIDDALKSYEIFSNASREEMVDALIEFGMLAELVGRIPTIAPLKPLSKEELMEVLLKSTVSPVEKQKNIFEKSGFNLTFSEEFLNKIVDLSYNSATGTRALDSYVKLAVSMASFDLLTLSKNKSAKGNIIIGEACITDPSLYEKSKLHIGNTAISTSAAI